jgi:hypothetical protein
MDRRLIRTAVFGSSDSDEPALCPETAEELDAFRREYENVTIWCGTMFEGGCGRRLMTRRLHRQDLSLRPLRKQRGRPLVRP